MPGRTSTRSTRTSSTASVARKSSTGPAQVDPRRPPHGSPPTCRRDTRRGAFDVAAFTQIAQVFGDAQKTTAATQRKAGCDPEEDSRGLLLSSRRNLGRRAGRKGKSEVQQEDFDEEDFNSEVVTVRAEDSRCQEE